MRQIEKYVQELQDKIIDLKDAIEHSDSSTTLDVIDECRVILDDISCNV